VLTKLREVPNSRELKKSELLLRDILIFFDLQLLDCCARVQREKYLWTCLFACTRRCHQLSGDMYVSVMTFFTKTAWFSSFHSPKYFLQFDCRYELKKLGANLRSEAGGNMLKAEERRPISCTMAVSARDFRQRTHEWKFEPGGEFCQPDRLPDQLFGSGHSLNINESPESGQQSPWSFQNTCSNPSERTRSSSCTGASTETRYTDRLFSCWLLFQHALRRKASRGWSTNTR